MGTIDKWLMETTKPVWHELAEGDCNPDLIPFALCDACEIGFDKGFVAGFGITALAVGGGLIGAGVVAYFKKKQLEKQSE